MKKICLFLLIATVTISLKAQFKAENTALITKIFNQADIRNVDAETSGGNISVTGINGETKVEVYAVPNNSKNNKWSEQEIKDKLNKDYDVKIELLNEKLTVTSKPKNNRMDWKNALSISFKMHLPKNVSTNLSTSGGNIELINVTGIQEITTSGGNLIITEVAGKLDGTTSGGSIIIEKSRDDIELVTSGGNIQAKNCDGKLKLTTSGGNLTLEYLKGNIKATTSGGNISGQLIEGELATSTSGGNIDLSLLSCSVQASTSGGDIAVSVKKLQGYVRIANTSGNVKLDIPQNSGADLDLSADKIKTDRMDDFSGKVDEEKVEGKLNGGGASITVRANGGRIYLGLK